MSKVTIATAAPQFLVDDLEVSISFYEEVLGFELDFVYEGFYASVTRDGATIHLKCAPKLAAERTHRKGHEHLDAYLDVTGVDALHDEFAGKGTSIIHALAERPWGRREFYVEDPDGYILCISEGV